MYIYEFVTPSDPITFITDDDKVAFAASLLVGSGKAGCHRNDENNNRVNIPALLLFASEPEKDMDEYVGGNFKEFIETNKPKLKKCLESFAYGNIEDRVTYDNAIEAITEPEKLKEFKTKHEDRNRTSISAWVTYAWGLAKGLK